MVSVILPARNEEKYIEKCLESLAAQDYKNLEIIAIDDSSTDETGNIIEKMSKKHKNIIHVKQTQNQMDGLGKTGRAHKAASALLESCYSLRMQTLCIHRAHSPWR